MTTDDAEKNRKSFNELQPTNVIKLLMLTERLLYPTMAKVSLMTGRWYFSYCDSKVGLKW